LAAKAEYDRVRLFNLDHFLYIARVDGHWVYFICKARVSLDRSDVGVYQYALYSFFGQRLETLRTGVVEFAASLLALARFSDFYCPATQYKDFLNRLISWRLFSLLSF
jgi:hypothetical protein